MFDFDLEEEGVFEDGFSIVNPLCELKNDTVLNSPDEFGLSLGFGDFISDERLKALSNLTENTDKENMETATTFVSIHSHKKQEKLHSFEKFVDNLCKGKISIDDDDY